MKTLFASFLSKILTRKFIKELSIKLLTYLVEKSENKLDDKLLPDMIAAINKV